MGGEKLDKEVLSEPVSLANPLSRLVETGKERQFQWVSSERRARTHNTLGTVSNEYKIEMPHL